MTGPRKRSKICVLASGGIESCVLLYLLARKYDAVFPLYVSHGYIWEKKEQYWLKQFLLHVRRPSLKQVTVLRLPLASVLRNHWSLTGRHVPAASSDDRAVYLPGRNLILLSLAGQFCAMNSIREVAIGTLASNPFPDSSPAFFRDMERALTKATHRPFKIRRPFAHLKKREVIRLARHAPLELSFSCLHPRGRLHCGRCNKCAERYRAMTTTTHPSRPRR